MKKYTTKLYKETGLLRITALIDIPYIGIRIGDRGGLIEKESNLSHEGNCWVGVDARVSDDVRVFGNACVSGDAQVADNTRVFEDACLSGHAWVIGNAWVSGGAEVTGSRHVITVGPVGSRHSMLTLFKTKTGSSVTTGCFGGTLDEFEAAVKEKPEGDPHRNVYESLITTFRQIGRAHV